MSSLDDIFDAPETGSESKTTFTNPRLKLDYRAEETATYRVLDDLQKSEVHPDATKMKLVIRHFVEGVGYVTCGQKIGAKTIDGKKVPQLWSSDLVKPDALEDLDDWQKDAAKPYIKDGQTKGYFIPSCKFCHERSVVKAKMKEENGGKDLTKAQSSEAAKLHKRNIELVARAEATVRDGSGKVVKDKVPCTVHHDVLDLFFTQQNRQYGQLAAKFKKKKTLLDTWFTMGSDGQIDFDDPVTKEDRKRDEKILSEVSLDYLDKQTKSYDDGLAKYLSKSKSVSEATDLSEDENVPFDLDDDNGEPSF
jgi:hypothetical protein